MKLFNSNAKKILLVTGLCVCVLALQTHKAYAHFPETEGSLTAIMHVEPDDYPPATKPETVYFIFSDTSNKFKLANCACDLTISEKGKVLYYSAIAPPPAGKPTEYSTSGNPFTFPNQDTYQIRLLGTPLEPGDFTPFNLNWNFHVGPSISASGTSYRTMIIYFLIILAAFLIFAVILHVFLQWF